MTTAFISETELRAYAPHLDLSAYTSATISGMLTRATALVENYLNYSLAFETKTEKVQGFVDPSGDIWFFPNKRPVVALNSVTLKKGSFSSQLTISNGDTQYYDIIDDVKVIISASEISLSTVSIVNYAALKNTKFWLQINYDCGYQAYDRPSDLMEAVSLFAQDLFAKGKNTSGASEISQGGLSIKYADTKGKSDFIKDAESILQSYQSVTGF